jgi:2-succinyl-5-enolpyruvyl-6-hydroxy-3-cyclohexene-1-carboxylate synthase
MNPATALARVLVDELTRCGVREAVLAPGSRSAPFAVALHDADAAGRLRLHVRIDERSAAFLALGLAARSGRPVPVVCTSGTAAANLHPAILEAAHAGLPLLALTADRPPELRGVGANQTVDQLKLYGDAVRMFHEVGVPERRTGQVGYWRTLVCRAVAAMRDPTRPGPAHLNLGVREPLLPDDDGDWCEPLTGRPDGGPWTAVAATRPAPEEAAYDGAGRGLVVAAVPDAAAAACAAELGWPLVVETAGAGCAAPTLISAGVWLLGDAAFLGRHRPDRVLCWGRPTLFREVQRLLADPDVSVDVVSERADWPAPGGNVRAVRRSAPRVASSADPDWLQSWQQADGLARKALDEALDAEPELTALQVGRELLREVPEPALLVLGSSQPIRDVGLTAAPRAGVRLVANRGVAGIDGTVSTAIGAALAEQRESPGTPAYALIGDLTFLHDANGLVLGPDEPRPDLTVVVVNNDGGAIFGLLEPGEPGHGASFERVFGTPHGVDLAALCAASGTRYRRVSTTADLRAAIGSRPDGVQVVEAVVDRRPTRSRQQELRAAVGAALA